MFSLKEWNFEEYKAAVKEIEDPVDRLDELNATRGYAFLEEMVDDFTYKLEALILMGFTPDDFFKSFCLKNGKNVHRVRGDY